MFGDGSLTFREFATREPLPLARVHDAVLDFLRGRHDAMLVGTQAVNAYVDESRMTQDVDVLSPRAAGLAGEIRRHIEQVFQIDLRVQAAPGGILFGVQQLREPKNRHLVNVRQIVAPPPIQRVEEVLMLTPPALVAAKVLSMTNRSNTPKGMQDEVDLLRLLLTFPELKTTHGPVRDCLEHAEASSETLMAWEELAAQEILPDDEDAGY